MERKWREKWQWKCQWEYHQNTNPQRKFQQQTSSKSTQQIPLQFVDNHFRQKIEISVLTQSAHIIKADGT